MGSVTVRLPAAVLEELDELASSWGLTRSGVVERLVERAVRARERERARPAKPWSERIALGLCGKCGTDRPLVSQSMCAPCLAMTRRAQERMKVRRALAKAR